MVERKGQLNEVFVLGALLLLLVLVTAGLLLVNYSDRVSLSKDEFMIKYGGADCHDSCVAKLGRVNISGAWNYKPAVSGLGYFHDSECWCNYTQIG